ncbi:MAG: bifunctional phosphoribosylaminoimidazolecarboxamide formyltransferase/IMP cyclohydrolase [Armatimonadota bacterium]
MKRALISVYKKEGIEDFARSLKKLGWEIISTSGTAKILEKAGIEITPVETLTQYPEVFDGRLKTISFQIEAGILFNREDPRHVKDAEVSGVKSIDMVICNFYPFADIAASAGTADEAIEGIDVGGPTMARAAAKNFKNVVVVTDPSQYQLIIDELNKYEEASFETRKKLASTAFYTLSKYDASVYKYFNKKFFNEESYDLRLNKGKKLRYGENPHQEGYFYKTDAEDGLVISDFMKIQGKELSFNNILDLDRALNALSFIAGKEPACVIVKHGNPCGAARRAAVRDNAENAFLNAWDGDSLAAFGGVIVINKEVSKELAEFMLKDGRFFEILAAPEVSEGAKEIFSKKPKLIILKNPALYNPALNKEKDYKKVRGGFLVQSPDIYELKKENLKVVTKTSPSEAQTEDMIFAWQICRASISNTVVMVKDKKLISSGAGQQDRKRAAELAVIKAGDRAKGCVAASDGFFPFSDGPEILLKAGVSAVIQPGGSIRDKDTIGVCDKYNIPMVFTGLRCFKH